MLCQLCIDLIRACTKHARSGAVPHQFHSIHGTSSLRLTSAQDSCTSCQFFSQNSKVSISSGERVIGGKSPCSFHYVGSFFEFFRPRLSDFSHDLDSSFPRPQGPPWEEPWRNMQRAVSPNPRSEHCIGIIRTMLKACQTNHEKCKRSDILPPLPRRVIDVGCPFSDGADLQSYLFDTEGQRGEYAALSYCWGGEQESKTTLANLEQYKAAILLDEFPKTLQDAITVTQNLEIRYLWIDVMCIVQDALEDKQKELDSIGEVFMNALFTISALNSPTSQHGFLHQRTPTPEVLISDAGIPESLSDPIGIRVALPSYDDEIKVSPMALRGWIFQERCLSQATLYFGQSQIFWECKTEVLSEAIPVVGGFTTEDIGRRFWERMETPMARDLDRYHEWNHITRIFSKKAFTNKSDRLAAIQAVSRQFEVLYKTRMLAGIWLDGLHVGLGWCYDSESSSEGTLCNIIPQSPSWSFVSVDYPVTSLVTDLNPSEYTQDVKPHPKHYPEFSYGYCHANQNMTEDSAMNTILKPRKARWTNTDHITLHLQGSLAEVTTIRSSPIPNGTTKIDILSSSSQLTSPLRGHLDPGRTVPNKLYLIRIFSSKYHGNRIHGPGSIAVFLLLKRVEEQDSRSAGHLGDFERVGIGQGWMHQVQDFFRNSHAGHFTLL